jgi:hypothetical protein
MSDDQPKRAHVRNRVGISRRDLLRRGAVVGGTALWTVPVIASVTRAHVQPGSPAFVCCRCHSPAPQLPGGPPLPPKQCTTTVDNPTACQQYCEGIGYKQSDFHAAPTPIQCRSNGNCESH